MKRSLSLLLIVLFLSAPAFAGSREEPDGTRVTWDKWVACFEGIYVVYDGPAFEVRRNRKNPGVLRIVTPVGEVTIIGGQCRISDFELEMSRRTKNGDPPDDE